MNVNQLNVVVIGGGLSGLAAGNYLFDQGERNFIVLEARDRVGGRTCTINHKGCPVDLGGAYVGPFQNRILRLAREFGVQTYRVDNKGKNILKLSNKRRIEYSGAIPTPIGIFNLLDLNYILCRTEELAEQLKNEPPYMNEDLMRKYDSMTVEDWLLTISETDEAKEIYRTAVRTIVCVEPNELSMFAWLVYVNNGCGIIRLCEVENGAQERKFAGGSQQISAGLRHKLGTGRVLLDHVVKKVQWSSTSQFVQVTCQNGEKFSCRHLIVALAPSLYKTIEFEPQLPDTKLYASQQMYMGSIIKTFTVFDRPYWKEKGYSGSILNTSQASQPVAFSFDDTRREHDFYAIMGFVVADCSRHWAKKTVEERRAAICAQYAEAFKCPEMIEGCVDYIEQNWCEEVFSGGCYTDIMPKNLLSTLKEELWTPCGENGKIFFAGTELATRFSGYMDGAVQAGERAAFEILTKFLRKDDPDKILTWTNDEPVHEHEACQPADVNQWMLGPSKIEMMLPKASTMRTFFLCASIAIIGIAIKLLYF